jgi:hypothetical protein
MSVFLNVNPETGQYNHHANMDRDKTVISNCIPEIPETAYLETVFDHSGNFFLNRALVWDQRIKNGHPLTSILIME